MRIFRSDKLLAPLLAVPLAALLAWSMLWNYMQTQITGLADGFEFEVVQGASLTAVAENLADEQVLEWPQLFTLWARLTGSAGRIRAGVYSLESGTTLAGVLDSMEQGKVILYPVTILEGWTFAELRVSLATHPAIVATLDPTAPDLADIFPEEVADDGHPEGRFFPDTYMVARNTPDADVLRQASKLMAEKLAQAWNGREPELPLASPYELLVLASIVEREAALDSERAKIAGVFIRRLQRGMRLQTDPSVIYGLGDDFDGNLTRAHLQTDNPYNTYTRGGLPPTPIGLPGEASLYAAAHPEPGDTIFFVASGKGDGSHVFSKTLAEHNAAVAAYVGMQRKANTAAQSKATVIGTNKDTDRDSRKEGNNL